MSLFYVAMSRVIKVSAGPLGAKPTSVLRHIVGGKTPVRASW